jgi:hypothetical protein
MNLLGAVLPALRGLRAPLSAGLIILVGVWLLADPSVSRHTAHPMGIYKSLDDLNGAIKVGLAGVAVFVASVVGGVITTFVAAGVNVVSRGGWSRPLAPWLEDARKSAADHAVRSFGLPLRSPVPEHLKVRLEALCDVPGRAKFWRYFSPDAWVYVRERQREWRQLRFRLLRERPEVFNEIDRLEAEAEFRSAVALPVAFLGVAVAIAAPGRDWPYWVGGAVLALLLFAAGVATSIAVEQTMADLVADRVVRLPVIAAIFGEPSADSAPRPAGQAR